MEQTPLIGLDRIEAAQRVLRGVARCTPLEGSRVLSALVGGPVSFKCENLQRTGSFKIRGAYTRIARLGAAERSRGVVAASAGNHAQGVALAAALHDAAATVYMPAGVPLPKVEATAGYGARVEFVGETIDEALQAARQHADRDGSVFIHPFDHPDVMAGQGTVGLEIVQQCPDVATVVVPLGGGGLVSGVAAAVKALRADVRVVGVQAAGAAAWPASLRAGQPVGLTESQTIADGIAVGMPGQYTFQHVRALVDEVRTVSEESLSQALLLCLERAKLVVEPAGAAAVAAVSDEPGAFRPPVVVVLSGGNLDPLLLGKVIDHGLAAAGRFPSLTVRMPDRPGSLVRLLEVLATTGANVLDVEHHRTGGELALQDVDVAVQLETRGPEHSGRVRTALRQAGYGVS
ncbi:MAG TPA: threonine ammonia-lyase [Mycobacteriales bacterium]|nr:threonine ammonia-lyase [Mycobacteriales bacterium]